MLLATYVLCICCTVISDDVEYQIPNLITYLDQHPVVKIE